MEFDGIENVNDMSREDIAGHKDHQLRYLKHNITQKPEYMDATHPLHSDCIRAVSVIYEELEGRKSSRRSGADRTDAETRQLKLDDPSTMTEEELQKMDWFYKPRPGFDTPEFRDSLPDHLKKFFEKRYGPPQDEARKV